MRRDEIVAESIGVSGCARCGGDHEILTWKTFDRVADFESHGQAVGVKATHWAQCPDTGDPILLMEYSVDDSTTPIPPEQHECGGSWRFVEWVGPKRWATFQCDCTKIETVEYPQ